jgi:hypothetical protein
MAGQITFRDGRPVSFVGEDATEFFRLAVLISALQFNIKTGMSIARNYRFATIKQATGLKTNDKEKHLARLREMIVEQRAKCTELHEETTSMGEMSQK